MIKTLFKSIREYKLPSILCPVVMVGEAVMEILIPYFMTKVVGQFTAVSRGLQTALDINVILTYSGLMVLCAVFALLCGIWGGKLAAKASCGFAHNLREDMYNNLQSYSFANIDKFSTSSLITRITTDVTNVQNAYQMCIRMLVRAPVLFVSAVVMSAIIVPMMAIIFACLK